MLNIRPCDTAAGVTIVIVVKCLWTVSGPTLGMVVPLCSALFLCLEQCDSPHTAHEMVDISPTGSCPSWVVRKSKPRDINGSLKEEKGVVPWTYFADLINHESSKS